MYLRDFFALKPASTTTVYARSSFYPNLRFTLSLQSAFYPWSTVCSLQSAVCVLHWPFYERIENQGTQTLAVWMFIELLARMCNVLRLRSEVCNWLPASYLKKKEYSLHSAFCTQPAFYSQSAVCILHSVCILPLVRSLLFTLTDSWNIFPLTSRITSLSLVLF